MPSPLFFPPVFATYYLMKQRRNLAENLALHYAWLAKQSSVKCKEKRWMLRWCVCVCKFCSDTAGVVMQSGALGGNTQGHQKQLNLD